MDWMNEILPGCLILVPVLYLVGCLLKKAAFLADRWIPLVLGGLGILLAFLSLFVAKELPLDGKGWADLLLSAVVQGVLCAGGAVYGNQVYKQAVKEGEV